MIKTKFCDINVARCAVQSMLHFGVVPKIFLLTYL
jgi:hypothetical protein